MGRVQRTSKCVKGKEYGGEAQEFDSGAKALTDFLAIRKRRRTIVYLS
jgi:hypothetical protein